jgi:hypothetical protein
LISSFPFFCLSFISFFPLLFCHVGVHCSITKVLDASTISYLNSPLFCSLLSLPSLIHGILTRGIIITFTCMCTHFLHYIHPPSNFPCYFPPSTSANHLPLSRTCSAFLFSSFAGEKR